MEASFQLSYTVKRKGKGSPYSITERKVPGLIPVLGNQSAITFRHARGYPRNPQEGCYQFRCLVNEGTIGVNSLPKTVTRQCRGCDLNSGTTAPESSTLTTPLPQSYTVFRGNSDISKIAVLPSGTLSQTLELEHSLVPAIVLSSRNVGLFFVSQSLRR